MRPASRYKIVVGFAFHSLLMFIFCPCLRTDLFFPSGFISIATNSSVYYVGMGICGSKH